MKLTTLFTILLSLGASVQAEVPSTLNYQGRVLQNGQPFDGTGHFVYGIYEGPTLLWTNKLPVPSPLNDPTAAIDSSDAKALTVRNGVFTVRLGEGDANNAPVGTDVFFKFDGTQRVRTDVKLAVWFSPAAEGPYTRLDPDITFASVPFAHIAGVAVGVQEDSVTGSMLVDGAVGESNLDSGVVTRAKLAPNVVTPAGTIVAYIGETAPPGWHLCHGDDLPRGGENLDLELAVGSRFGLAANPATHFKLPDFRGYFLRGVDGMAGRDPDKNARMPMATGGATGNAIGSIQGDELKAHSHELPLRVIGGIAYLVGSGNASDAGNPRSITSPTGGNETRPKNAYVNYIIKY